MKQVPAPEQVKDMEQWHFESNWLERSTVLSDGETMCNVFTRFEKYHKTECMKYTILEEAETPGATRLEIVGQIHVKEFREQEADVRQKSATTVAATAPFASAASEATADELVPLPPFSPVSPVDELVPLPPFSPKTPTRETNTASAESGVKKRKLLTAGNAPAPEPTC